MERAPQISVLVTSYNREIYLGPCLDSVLAQTWRDFEVIVVDDGSADRSVEVARRYERLDRRVRVHVNETNLGQFGNRNRAAELARAPFLKYHDSDDLMYPHCLATLLGPLRAEPRAGFALSAGAAWPGGPCPMLSTPLMSYRREFLGLGMFHCGPAGALFRREVFHDLGGFEDHGVASDYLFWMRVCRKVSVLLMPADLFWYRLHPGQELQSPKSAASYALAHGEAWRALQAPDCPLQGEELQQARRNLAWTLFKLTYRDLRGSQWGNAWLRLRKSGVSPADWLRYLRRPKRHFNAGTPLDVDGGYQIPDWTRFDLAEKPVQSERG
jgi:hypothetical protein